MFYGAKPPEKKVLRYKPVPLPNDIYWRYFRRKKRHYLFRTSVHGALEVLGSIYKVYNSEHKFRAESFYNNDFSSQLFKTLRASKRFVERESYFKGAFN